MRISIFTCILNPDFWCFPYQEALKSYCELADEVVVVDGGSNDGSLNKIKKISDKIKIVELPWPWEYKQREFPLHLNYGLDNCSGDWVIKMDIDFVLHEFDILGFKRKLEEHNDNQNIEVASFIKLNMLSRFCGFTKGEVSWAIHKKFTKNKVKFGVEIDRQTPDWSQAIRVKEMRDGIPYGNVINIDTKAKEIMDVLRLNQRVFNYDCFFRTREKCKSWFARSARAYLNETGQPLYGNSDEDSWKQWKNIREYQREIYEKIAFKIEDHPKFMQDKIKSMTPDMFGYNNWDWEL